MKVAFISTVFAYPWGGPDKRWTMAAKACLDRGDEVFLGIAQLTAHHPLVENLVRGGAKLRIRSGSAIWRGKKEAFLRQLPILKREHIEGQLENFNPDVVFILLGGSFDVLAEVHLIDFLQRKGIPYVASCSLATEGTILKDDEKAYLQKFFLQSAATLFMSSANKALAEEQLGMNISNARLIQNPLIIACDDVLPFPTTSSRPQIGFVGRIDIMHKGLDMFMEALGRVHSQFPVDFHLTGRNQDQEAMAELIKKHRLEDCVHIHAHTTEEELLQTYARSELIVLTSRKEGCASTMLEAMMVGRPLLVTPVGGVSDWLVDGESAFIAEDVSTDAIETALNRALSQREHWEEMGRAARRAFDTKRDSDPVGTLVGIFDEINKVVSVQ